MSLLNNIKRGQSVNPPRIMMIGVEGVGKSTAGASMPNPLFICSENGLVGPQFDNVSSFNPSSWADILAVLDEIAANKTEFKSIVIDTLDWVEPMLYAHVCANQGKGCKNIEDFGYGKGYIVAQQEARQLITRLEKLNSMGFYIMILCHSQIKTFQNPVGENYDRYEPKVNLKIAGLFKEWCDTILFAQFDSFTRKEGMKAKAYGGQARIVQTTHSAAWDAKNRYGLPEVMTLDMVEILKAMNVTAEKDTTDMEKELQGYIKKMKEEDAEKWNKWYNSRKWTPEQLAQKLNKLRVSENMNNEKEGENA